MRWWAKFLRRLARKRLTEAGWERLSVPARRSVATVSMDVERWELASARLDAAWSLAWARAWKVQRVGGWGEGSMRQRRPAAVWCWQWDGSDGEVDLEGIGVLFCWSCEGGDGLRCGDVWDEKMTAGTPWVLVKQFDSM